MAKIWYLLIFIVLSAHAQENARRNLPSFLRDCYENKYLLERDNRPPHTLNTFIAILRKIENTNGLNMDLRSLSVALLHRFRQDGITSNPDIPSQDGITPFAPNAFQFFRFAKTLQLIPGNTNLFPNNSITDIERCTLHFMLSSSIEVYERGDEAKVCRFVNAYRYPRDVKDNDKATKDAVNDVETLSSDEIQTKTHNKDKDKHVTIDPNSLYPELPPNHPDSARLFNLPPYSKCPVENGVVKTPWGATSFGLVLAGIAAATQPQTTMLHNLQPDILHNNTNLSTHLERLSLDNKWFATLAGDLAEVALRQGPTKDKLSVGVTGNWNSTALPRWYFLNKNDKFEMTTAEIRGDLDGLILAKEVYEAYSKVPSLRLSQIFDMYYNRLGFFNHLIRACDRGTLFTSVAPKETMVAQTYSAALILSSDISHATLESAVIEKFSTEAVNQLATYVPLSMNKDLSCSDTHKLYDLNPISVDLTIILDTNWEFQAIKPMLAYLLENIDLNQFNSNFTLINGHNGTPMINSTFDLLEFYAFNSSHYENVTHGFELAKSLKQLEIYLMNKLNNERLGVGGARSDVVLIVAHNSDTFEKDKEYCLQTISQMRERIPDTTLLIMTYGSKDTWSNLVQNPITDLFSISTGDTEETLQPIMNIVSRIRQVPKRLFNTQCGSNYISSGPSNSYDDYVVPGGINFYKLHPNYFFNGHNTAKIKIQASGSNSLTVCSSRIPLNVNTTGISQSCALISNNAHVIAISCDNGAFIHDCRPLYISIASNSSTISYQCTDGRVCRFPNLNKYTISYENLVCTSGATKIAINSFILIIALVFFNI